MNNAEKYKINKKVEEAEQGTERFQLCVQSAPRPRYLAKEYALPRHCVFVKYKQKTKKKIQIQSAPFQEDVLPHKRGSDWGQISIQMATGGKGVHLCA